ncbi:unnamed protein product [Bursaphelenchus xylophilus]|uniref:(pine wood nematode) hypothetical protein n=1 Tax=Bursaphelenchus xylophilus TaxID=6326 RepID=A0A1I7STS1_BURXY|nr:unnamed protein product [Bursaphelenchus xylophilus]CAG9108043.1 unnamed protein product [Bursaphelenchus xylophilus]
MFYDETNREKPILNETNWKFGGLIGLELTGKLEIGKGTIKAFENNWTSDTRQHKQIKQNDSLRLTNGHLARDLTALSAFRPQTLRTGHLIPPFIRHPSGLGAPRTLRPF